MNIHRPSSPPVKTQRLHFGTSTFGSDAFGDGNATNRELSAYFADLGSRMDRLKYLNVNAEKPETLVQQAAARIKRGKLYRLIIAGLAGLSVLGALGRVGYEKSKPPAIALQQQGEIKPYWLNLVGTAKQASDLGKLNDGKLNTDFANQTQRFMMVLVDTMAARPTQEVDAQVVNRLRQELQHNSDMMPYKQATAIAGDIKQYLEKEAKLPLHDPSDRQIEQAVRGLRSELIDLTVGLKDLSDAEKTQLVVDIKSAIRNAKTDWAYTDTFQPAVLGHLNIAYAGVSLKQFSSIHSAHDAVSLFTSIVNNPKNFRELSSAERSAFLAQGTQVLNTLDLKAPSVGYGLATLALLFIASKGAIGLAVLKRKDVFGVGAAKADLEAALQNPTLFVNNGDRGDADGQRKIQRLNTKITEQVTQMAANLRSAYATNSTVKAFLSELFGAENKLPTADWLRQTFTYQAATALVAAQSRQERLAETPIGELALLEKVLSGTEIAYAAGEYLVLDADIAGNEAAASKHSAASGRDQLETEKIRVDHLISTTMKAYTNTVLGMMAAEQQLASVTAKLSEIENKMREGGKLNAGEITTELIALNTQRDALKAEKSQAETVKASAEIRLATGDTLIEEYLPSLKAYRTRLADALRQQTVNKTLADLRAVQESGKTQVVDPKLTEILDQNRIDTYLAEQAREKEAMQKRVEARMKAQLNNPAQNNPALISESASS
ncbi:MAG: hypothetical protein K2X01_10305 [Cyanobacteria bacterium]|nr:hypothetical protein [Cyanobacteriota bacterium]